MFCKWTLLRLTLSEVKGLHPTSSRHEMCTPSVSNVIYCKFSHRAASYMLNWKNVLELEILSRVMDIDRHELWSV